MFEKRLRKNYRLRAFGHNPMAANCMFAEPWDFILSKISCEQCVKIREKQRRIIGSLKGDRV